MSDTIELAGPAGARPVLTPEPRAQALHDSVSALRAAIAASSGARMGAWASRLGRSDFAASAANLADYLALRQNDLRPLQRSLAALGLSSLGRCEGHVRATVDAVLAALAAIAGQGAGEFPPPATFEAGQKLLAARRDALFGAAPQGPLTRIMVTLPSEAATDAALVQRLVDEGASAVRINCAHDDAAAWAAMIANTRAAATKAGRRVPVEMDLGGPKIRIDAVRNAEKIKLHPGDRFVLAAEPEAPGLVPAGLPLATLDPPALLDHLDPGTAVWINDGKLRARVIERQGTAALMEVTGAREKGEKLKPEKGVNLPGIDLSIAALTDYDRECLGFVAANADMIGFSFVQSVADVEALVAELSARCADRPLPAIMLKIETPLAVRNLPDLIVAAGGAVPVAVMIARGDLAVEIGFERLSEMQEEILWLCEAAQVPVVWATQVLEGLLKDGQASRAETTDAAMGQRAECVMLNKGTYLPEAVVFLRSILGRMDRHQDKKFAHLGPLHVWSQG